MRFTRADEICMNDEAMREEPRPEMSDEEEQRVHIMHDVSSAWGQHRLPC